MRVFRVGINKRPRAETAVLENAPPAPPISMLRALAGMFAPGINKRPFLFTRTVAQNSFNIEIGGAGGAFWLTALSARGRLFIPTRKWL